MRDNRAPAFIGAVLFHALVFSLGFLSLPYWGKPIQLADAVPITIVSHAPPAPPTATEVAPTVTPETTPEPQPTPKPAPPPPPAPAPAPAPAPKPAAQSPKAAPKPLDLNALASSLPQAKVQPNRNGRPATPPVDLARLANTLPNTSGGRGRPQPATGPVINPGPPQQLTGDEMAGLQDKLGRLWGLNCGVDDSIELNVRVRFKLRPNGSLDGSPELLDSPIIEAKGPGAMTLARRAMAAVSRGDPYSELPKDRYGAWKQVTATFNTKRACANH